MKPGTTQKIITTFTLLILTSLPCLAAEYHIYPSEPDLIEIMFIQESVVRMVEGQPQDLSGLNAMDGVEAVIMGFGGGQWSRLTDIPEIELDDLAMNAELNLGQPVYNLNNIYRIRMYEPGPIEEIAYQLESLLGVHLAYPVALPPELPLSTDYTPSQNYLDPAASTPTGVDARYAWTQTGGTGSGVTICDLEYSWNYSHTDISKATGSQINTNVSDPFSNNDHGTAVIGELVADANGWGTTGVSYGASLLTCGTFYGLPTPSWNIAGAMAIAATTLSAGDVMLIEQQWDYTGAPGYVPIEWYPHTSGQAQSLNAVYAAIVNAVGNGITVVEAGGNGALSGTTWTGINTDTMTWYGNSGAIVVGAGGAYTGGGYPNGDLQRLGYSSYGSRFDLQAWGENVVTTGYGDKYSAEGVNVYYTATFSGTSSASPIVAGAVACLNGYYAANVSTTPLTPAAIRTNLITTGTAQITPPSGNIGPRPNLAAAIAAIIPPPPVYWTDVTAGPLGDTGYGKSVAWGDVDNDGDDDLYITNTQSQNHLFRNDGVLGFTDITTPVEANMMFAGAAEFGDFDNDHQPDIYCGNWGNTNRLYQNLGPVMFADATMPPVDDIQDGSGVAWIDFDNDGLLDLQISNMNGGMDKLFKNIGGGNFLDFTTPPMDNMFDSHDAAWCDYDQDGDMDCYMVNTNGPNDLMVNMGHGMFMPLGDPVLMDMGFGSGACWGDVDNDGDPDLYLTNQGSPNRLLRNDGPFFTDVTGGPLADPQQGMGASWADYDNDGDLDLYLANQNGVNKLLRNDGNYVFTDDTNGPLGDNGPGQGTAWADYDNDGDLDIYLMNAGISNKLFRNDINNGNHWFQLQLNGFNCNASAIGARVRIVVAGQVQYRELGTAAGYCSQNSFRLHFGLGQATMVDSVIVRWPGYGIETLTNLAADQLIFMGQNPLSAVDPGATPKVCRILPAAPNPFNPATNLRFELSKAGPVKLEIFDIAGRRLRTLADGEFAAGPQQVTWRGHDDHGRQLASGVYFACLQAEGKRQTTKLVLTK